MQFNRKVHANNPALTAGSGVLRLAAAAGGAALADAIATANPAGNVNEINGLLISASTGSDVYIRSAVGGGAGTGVLISAGQSLFLPIVEWPSNAIHYECATAVDVMVFLARMPSLGTP